MSVAHVARLGAGAPENRGWVRVADVEADDHENNLLEDGHAQEDGRVAVKDAEARIVTKITNTGVNHADNEEGTAEVDRVERDSLVAGQKVDGRRKPAENAEHESQAGDEERESNLEKNRDRAAAHSLDSTANTDTKTGQTDHVDKEEDVLGESQDGFIDAAEEADGSQGQRRNTEEIAGELSDDDGTTSVGHEKKLADGGDDTQETEYEEEAPAGRDGSDALLKAENRGKEQTGDECNELQDGNAITVCEVGHRGDAEGCPSSGELPRPFGRNEVERGLFPLEEETG